MTRATKKVIAEALTMLDGSAGSREFAMRQLLYVHRDLEHDRDDLHAVEDAIMLLSAGDEAGAAERLNSHT